MTGQTCSRKGHSYLQEQHGQEPGGQGCQLGEVRRPRPRASGRLNKPGPEPTRSVTCLHPMPRKTFLQDETEEGGTLGQMQALCTRRPWPRPWSGRACCTHRGRPFLGSDSPTGSDTLTWVHCRGLEVGRRKERLRGQKRTKAGVLPPLNWALVAQERTGCELDTGLGAYIPV